MSGLFFSTFVVRSLPSIYAAGLYHAPGFQSECLRLTPAMQSIGENDLLLRQATRKLRAHSWTAGRSLAAKVDADRLLIEGRRCSTICWRKPDSTSIEKRGVWSCGEKKVTVRPCHVTNITCWLIWPYSIIFSPFFFVRPSFVPIGSRRYLASSLKSARSNLPFSNAAANVTCLSSLPQMVFFPSNFLSISL